MPSKEPEELEIDIDDIEEDEVLISYDIASYPSDFTLSGIVEMWNRSDITIPDFQREFVWNIRQSSLLIESFLLGLPVPPVFFYIDDENINLVIDGQQRILSIIFYFEGFFGFENIQGSRRVFRLQGLDEKSPYYKKKFTELSESDQRLLHTTVLRAINIRQLSPKEDNTSIYHIFERLNTGGTPLKPQEIRNVVFRGNFVNILRELNSDDNWRLILGKKSKDKHQKDVELVLRLFALSRISTKYEKPMKEFLNQAMKRNRNGDNTAVKRFTDLFRKTSELIVEKLGEKPFHIRGPLNTGLLDSVFCNLLDNQKKIPGDLKDRFNKLVKDKTLLELSTSATTDTQTVKDRFKLVNEYLIK